MQQHVVERRCTVVPQRLGDMSERFARDRLHRPRLAGGLAAGADGDLEGEDPDDAKERSVNEVEGYLQ